MQQAFSAHHVESPEFMGIHYMDATTVEECWRLLRQTGKSNSLRVAGQPPALHRSGCRAQDWTDAYARHKQNLQLIGLNDPDKRWVLKNPSHMTALDALMAVYPDALIVYTHRDPVTCIASSCSLSAETTAGHSTTYVGETSSAAPSSTCGRGRSTRSTTRGRRTTRRSSSTSRSRTCVTTRSGVTRRDLRAVRAATGRPRSQAAIEEIDRESKQGAARPSHTYALEDYGLTEDEVRARFS